MLIALTAVAVMAWRVSPSRQVTTATELASLRKASFVRAASESLKEIAACMLYLPRARVHQNTYSTVRYSNSGKLQSENCCGRRHFGDIPRFYAVTWELERGGRFDGYSVRHIVFLEFFGFRQFAGRPADLIAETARVRLPSSRSLLHGAGHRRNIV